MARRECGWDEGVAHARASDSELVGREQAYAYAGAPVGWVRLSVGETPGVSGRVRRDGVKGTCMCAHSCTGGVAGCGQDGG